MNTELTLSLIAAAMALGVGVLALYREPQRSRTGIAFAVGMALLGVDSLLAGLGASAVRPADVWVWHQWRLLAMALLPGCWLFFSLTYARGNEKEFVARWKAVLLAAFVLPLGMVTLAWNQLLSGKTVAGQDPMQMLALGQSGVLLHVLFTAGAILCLMNLELTLRESRGTMRWRVKYMIVGVGFLFAVQCYGTIQAFLYSAINTNLTGLNAGSLAIGCVFMSVALSRGSLGAVDLYLSNGALYGSLTAIVAGVYLLLVGLLAEVAARFGVSDSFPMHAFMILMGMGGITVVLLSDRLRQRAIRFVSRHFRRPQYDYRRVWTTFTERTTPIAEPTELCRVVTRIISDTFETLSVTIWLTDEHRGSFSLGGSTALSEETARTLGGDGKLERDVVRLLRDHVYPTAILGVSGELRKALQHMSRKEFEEGGEYYFLPLATRDELLGVLIMGDRVSGLPFTVEEFDLLRTIGNQIVANLLGIALAGRLGEAQKLEAFQTMSAFFVHDLKNTASTLSLLLQNLPKHYDNPSYRQDALRAISKSVDKINTLIARLSCFRQKTDVEPAASDLNAVIKDALAGLPGLGPDLVTTELNPLPTAMVDSDQFQKVIVNLVLNARDALGTEGRIGIRTEAQGGEVVLSVSDNGCGMTPEFMDQSLFRPFQTTKREGLGIGLFHSRMIVNAHRGRIEVESRRDQGTTFRVFLPAAREKT